MDKGDGCFFVNELSRGNIGYDNFGINSLSFDSVDRWTIQPLLDLSVTVIGAIE